MHSRKPLFRPIKLHDRDERCWGVVDRDGALCDVDGLSMRMTKDEAVALAKNKTEEAELETTG